MTKPDWPDLLHPPDPAAVQMLLERFWDDLVELADLLPRQELLLAAERVARLRATVLAMMLALNGIERPPATRHLNGYLGPSQRAALEKTLVAPTGAAEDWLGQAVALVVIYRWYAPQLVERYQLRYPSDREAAVWATLRDALPAWPQAVTTG
ncbi:MAG TPA: hypothetical protein VNK95_12280 [Caldilineaceae bacterium]|nr:hypothetical protein [Caldilineaceae bacterium]